MKFTAKRLALLAMAKKVCKAVPAKSVVQILSGVLIEANADTFEVSLTATNYEIAVQCKMDCCVELSGSAVIDAKLFVQMLTLLDDDTVLAEISPNHLCTITGGTATYDIMTRPGKEYPKPEIPFPEDTLKISQLCSAAKNTVFAVDKGQNQAAIEGVRILIDHSQTRICGCDGRRLMEWEHKIQNNGKLNIILPARSFNTLAGMVQNTDTLELGITGNAAVFTKEGLLFSTSLIPGEYINVDSVFQNIQPEYAAVIDAREMTRALDSIHAISLGSGSVNMEFSDAEIKLFWEGETGKSQTAASADIQRKMPPEGFSYSIGLLGDVFRRLTGQIEMKISSLGIMTIHTENTRYFQMNMRKCQNNAKAAKKKEAAA
ncbi:MAG: DNA polymerase III subunit beta [Oscillospiraceae bacterium]|nr:DNA polymerase III subunit beta [Oscillospiraceae bacterium]